MKYLYLVCMITAVVADISLNSQVPIEEWRNDVNPDGTYSYSYATGNGIRGEESGTGGEFAQGSFSWQSPEGEQIVVRYTADADGYVPESPWIPTPPPIPEAIQRSLEYIARNAPRR